MKLSWTPVTDVATPVASPSPTPTPITVVIDDQDDGFQRGGLTTTWREETEGHSDHLYWTNNNDKTRTGYNWGRWSPDLEAASYEVFVYIPSNHATTGNAATGSPIQAALPCAKWISPNIPTSGSPWNLHLQRHKRGLHLPLRRDLRDVPLPQGRLGCDEVGKAAIAVSFQMK